MGGSAGLGPGAGVHGRRTLLLLLAGMLLFSASCRPREAQALDEWSEPLAGVRYLQRRTEDPLRVHAVVVDLCQPGISARATAPGEGPSTVSEFAGSVGADVAVNGDFFGEGYLPLGLAIGAGRRWPGTRDLRSYGLIAFSAERVWLPRPEDRVDQWFSTVQHAVGGRPALLREGEIVAPLRGGLCGNRHPRTAVGLSEDGRRLILAVVDGRSATSRGQTCRELAELMQELGSYEALNLDGGGSSALWIRGLGVVNRPSDGVERQVANHLGLRAPGEGPPSHCPADAAAPDSPGEDVAEASEAALDEGVEAPGGE